MARTLNVLRLLEVDFSSESEHIPRAILLLYLIDWKSCLEYNKTASDAEWTKIAWGPYSPEVFEAIAHIKNLGYHNRTMDSISDIDPFLTNIIHDVKKKYLSAELSDLKKIVLSTYPMLYQSDGNALDLPNLAEKYKKDFRKLRGQGSE